MRDELGAYRKDGPETQYAAAEHIGSRVGTIRAQVLALFVRWGDLTDQELFALYRAFHGPALDGTLRPRRVELVRSEHLVDTGVRKMNPQSHVMNIVWGVSR